MTCSCGTCDLHVIARRRLADGRGLVVWDDGAVTSPQGFGLPGVPIARPRSHATRERSRAAGMLLADVCSTYDTSEIPQLYRCARLLPPGATPGDLRARFALGALTESVRWVHVAPGVEFSDLHPPYAHLVLWRERGRVTVCRKVQGVRGPALAGGRDFGSVTAALRAVIDGVSQ